MRDPHRPKRIRSALFTPGTEATRLRKAIIAGADICIFDLEDSVPASRGPEARRIVADALLELAGKARLWVRVHRARGREMADDIAALPLSSLEGVVLPKVEDPDDVEVCAAAIAANQGPAALPILAIIESAAGVLNCQAIGRARGVVCLALGRFDLAAEIGIDPDQPTPALSAARAVIVLASAGAGSHPPLDSPWLKIRDVDGLRAYAEQGRRDGFGGMLLIHPSHVEPANQAFSPTPDQISWAKEIVASSSTPSRDGRGAYAREGEMVDEAIVRRARTILREAGGD